MQASVEFQDFSILESSSHGNHKNEGADEMFGPALFNYSIIRFNWFKHSHNDKEKSQIYNAPTYARLQKCVIDDYSQH